MQHESEKPIRFLALNVGDYKGGSQMLKEKEKYGMLTLVERAGTSKSGSVLWKCVCDCGKETIANAHNLKTGHTRSCGCLNHKKKNIDNKRLYSIWKNMRCRCYRTNNIGYRNYGAKGVGICEDWLHDFNSFAKWALENGYEENLTIDRIDVNGNYEPSNCRWSNNEVQQNNKRNCVYIFHDGKTQTIAQWAREKKIPYSTLSYRLTIANWDIESALEK